MKMRNSDHLNLTFIWMPGHRDKAGTELTIIAMLQGNTGHISSDSLT